MKNTYKILIAIIVVVIIVIGGFFIYQKYKKVPVVEKPVETIINSVTFNCANNKNIQAIFYSSKVDLVLNDGRSMSLPQAMSASGARYANTDESFVFWNKGDTAFVEEGNQTTFKDCSIKPKEIGMANPASVNCVKVGGNSVIKTDGSGGQYGLCYFEDNRACEEWALFRGDCPVGGRRTTGYDTIDQNYCVWRGGETLATKDSICTFKNGKKCSTIDFYNGKCSFSIDTGSSEGK